MFMGRAPMFGRRDKALSAAHILNIPGQSDNQWAYKSTVKDSAAVKVGDLMVAVGQGGSPGGGAAGAAWLYTDPGAGGSGYWYYRLVQDGDKANDLYWPPLTTGAVYRGPTKLGAPKFYQNEFNLGPFTYPGFNKDPDCLGFLLLDRVSFNTVGRGFEWTNLNDTARGSASYTQSGTTHSVQLRDMLIPPEAYVNGTSITRSGGTGSMPSGQSNTEVIVELLA